MDQLCQQAAGLINDAETEATNASNQEDAAAWQQQADDMRADALHGRCDFSAARVRQFNGPAVTGGMVTAR